MSDKEMFACVVCRSSENLKHYLLTHHSRNIQGGLEIKDVTKFYACRKCIIKICMQTTFNRSLGLNVMELKK